MTIKNDPLIASMVNMTILQDCAQKTRDSGSVVIFNISHICGLLFHMKYPKEA